MDCIIKEVTDDFCDAWDDPDENYQGFTARLVADSILPLGVDPRDERVKEIIKKCQEARKKANGYP